MGAVDPIQPWFKAQMRRLAGLKFAPSDLTTHWEALKDLPEVLIEAAVSHAQGATSEFPSPKDLRAYSELKRATALPIEPEQDRSEPLARPVNLGTLPTGVPIVAKRIWKYYDEQCSDTGWKAWWCGDPASGRRRPWVELGRCQRNKEHEAHEWVAECSCFTGNPEVQRRRERLAQGPRRGAKDNE